MELELEVKKLETRETKEACCQQIGDNVGVGCA